MQEQQFRAVRTDSTSFPRTLPRNRVDSENLRISTNSNSFLSSHSTSSSPTSSFISSSSFTSFNSSTSTKHTSVSTPIPVSPNTAKRTNSESYVSEKTILNINGTPRELTGSSSMPEFPKNNNPLSSSPPNFSSSIPTPPAAPPANNSSSSSSRISTIGKHFSRLMGSLQRDRGSKTLISSPSSSSISFPTISTPAPASSPSDFNPSSPTSVVPSPSNPFVDKVEERAKNERAGIVMGNKGEREDICKKDKIEQSVNNTEKVEKEEQGRKVENDSTNKEKEEGGISPRDYWKAKSDTEKKEHEEQAKDEAGNKIEKKNKNEKDNKEIKPVPPNEVIDQVPRRDTGHTLKSEVQKERNILLLFKIIIIILFIYLYSL